MQVKWEQVGCSMLMPESCGDFLFGRRLTSAVIPAARFPQILVSVWPQDTQVFVAMKMVERSYSHESIHDARSRDPQESSSPTARVVL
jgi:hypothetical protein